MEIKYKIIRKFEDTDKNIYTLCKKINNHYFLIIRKKYEVGGRIIEGNQVKLLKYLKEIYQNTKFIDIPKSDTDNLYHTLIK